MLRTEDAANYTGLSASTLTKLRLTGGGPEYIKIGKSVVYDPSDLETWLTSKRRRSTSVAA
ncbi:DNA-binding protein [Rhizobium anhuiense]|nr:DNA-binding protein [Rhizobium anhuiense]